MADNDVGNGADNGAGNADNGADSVQSTGVNENTDKSNSSDENSSKEYVLNLNTHKFHLPSCSSVKQMSNENKGTYTGDRQDLIEQGYEPCKNCNP